MNHRVLCGILLAGCLSACNLFESREQRTQKLVDAEIQTINFNEVDQFPLFDDCQETEDKTVQRRCFEETLLMHLSMTLQNFEFRSQASLKDTLHIDFKVDAQGVISITSVEQHPAIVEANPEFERIVTGSLRSLPRLQPALKRGIPVATRFRLPLVLQTDE
ncbi:hypothetical protein [Robiginitalea biformata]|uniref:TonB C-terminal domain-containing protein n=1 Tax=Robiginitalea biformata (strain ATCC BAA-864 / DSM 15991 / KCTC 12146 / HTCC2501) TaxID=313596 RepID=A4CGI7_ROBBH|nr:hypothetical protein [Robiginitalea biformata]EAR16045.1 hypothetical protein RB2501_04085 [Robiginitalea biformata HTCC2501]